MSTKCDNCQKKIGGVMFGEISATPNALNFLKQIHSDKERWCNNCARHAVYLYFDSEKLKQEITQLENEFTTHVQDVVSKFKLHTSSEYDGEYLSLVTGYSALGTGILTEVASTFTDAFGMQSESYKQKLNDSEKAAKEDLVNKAIYLGATATYGTKFQITEATAGKGILICYFSGMAIKENNKDTDLSNFLTVARNLKEKKAKLSQYYAILSDL